MVLVGIRDSVGWDLGGHLEYISEVRRQPPNPGPKT